MKKITTIIFAIALSFGVFAQQNDTMFVHSGQTIFHISTSEVDSIIFNRTGVSVPMGSTVIIRDTIRDTIFTVSGVTLNQTTATLIVDETLTLTATILPDNATNKAITWSSSNNDVATVLDGVVTAVSVGSATITVTTADGNKTATCTLIVLVATGCNTNTPGWGSSLGTVTRGTQEWTISDHGITQIWSDAVTAINCQKTTFNGGTLTPVNFNADCRSNPDYPGDLFSWCAVVRFQDQLCPAPWRVPTMQDFIDLDIALGGNGNNRTIAIPRFVADNYITRWGGRFGGYCNSSGSLLHQGNLGNYWSQTEFDTTTGRFLLFLTGYVSPQDWNYKTNGYAVRCVR